MIKAVIFDFDGVIVDSYEATIYYISKTIKHFNYPAPKKSDFKKLLGLKTRDIYQNLLPNLKDKEINKIHQHGKEESFKAVPKIILIDGVKETLKKLSKTYKLAVVSSRGERTLNVLLDKYQLRQFFQSIISREDVTNHKPHPEPIIKALKELKIKPFEAVYLGDMEEDILAAKRAEVISIFVKREGKDDYGSDYTVKNVIEIPRLLGSLL